MSSRTEYIYDQGSGNYMRTVTTTLKHAPAMTKAAAHALKSSIKWENPDADVVVERQNAAGAYLVRFAEVVYGNWSKMGGGT